MGKRIHDRGRDRSKVVPEKLPRGECYLWSGLIKSEAEGRALWYSYGKCQIVSNSSQVDGTNRIKFAGCHQDMWEIAKKKVFVKKFKIKQLGLLGCPVVN